MPYDPMKDVEILLRGRSLVSLPFEDEWTDSADGPDVVVLLVDGCALMNLNTRVGAHSVEVLHAPMFLNLSRVFAGTTDLCSFQPELESEAIVFSREDVQEAVSDRELDGQAFRRLALRSVTSILRATNASLNRIFSGLPQTVPSGKRLGGRRAGLSAIPFDEREAFILLDSAGIDTAFLPDLGLTAFEIPEEEPLVVAGSHGEDAFLLAEGRLRIELPVPGSEAEALAFLGPGEIVGEMALIDDSPRSATVVAHGGSAVVFRLSRVVFLTLLETGNPGGAPLLAGITLALARRVDEAVRRAAAFRVMAGAG